MSSKSHTRSLLRDFDNLESGTATVSMKIVDGFTARSEGIMQDKLLYLPVDRT